MRETIGAGIVDHRRDALTGIGGWLLVFLIWAGIMAAAGLFVGFATFVAGPLPEIDSLTAGYWIVVAVLAVSDIALILLRKRLAKHLSIFLCGMLVAIGGLSVILAVLNIIPAKFDEAASAARSLFFGCAWLGYFLRSERVTYTLVK